MLARVKDPEHVKVIAWAAMQKQREGVVVVNYIEDEFNQRGGDKEMTFRVVAERNRRTHLVRISCRLKTFEDFASDFATCACDEFKRITWRSGRICKHAAAVLLLHQAKDCKTSINRMDESLGDYFKSLFFQGFPEDVDCCDDQFNDSSFESARQLLSPLIYNRPVLESSSMASLREQLRSSSTEDTRRER